MIKYTVYIKDGGSVVIEAEDFNCETSLKFGKTLYLVFSIGKSPIAYVNADSVNAITTELLPS